MKKAIAMALLLSLLIVGCIYLISTEHDPFEKRDVDCMYQGALVIEKDTFWNTLSLKYKGEIIHTGYFQIQAHYKVGDRINGPCNN